MAGERFRGSTLRQDMKSGINNPHFQGRCIGQYKTWGNIHSCSDGNNETLINN